MNRRGPGKAGAAMEDQSRNARAGQSLIEGSLVIVLACLVFFGLFQVSQLYASKQILTYAAAAGARAEAVGFNDFMIYKVVRAAAIPVGGRMLVPDVADDRVGPAWGGMTPGEAWEAGLRASPGRSAQLEAEQSRIPLYLGADYYSELGAILDYERWDDLRHSQRIGGDEMAEVRTRQDIPLTMPFHRTFYDGDAVRMQSGEAEDNHYVGRGAHYLLYLE